MNKTVVRIEIIKKIFKNSTLLIIIFIASCLIIYANTDQKSNGGQENQFDPLIKAITIMGGDNLSGLKIAKENYAIDTIVIMDSTTPFLKQKFNNINAVKVTLRNMPVKYKRSKYGDSVNIEGERDFDVYLDPENGTLLKIVSTKDSYYKKIETGEIRKPTAEEAEKQLAGSKDKYFYTLSDPTPDFLKALEIMPGDPLRADQIIAMFVEYGVPGNTKPVWIIETYGVESISTGHHQFKVYQLNHIRCIVDTTGNSGFWNNEPYVTE